MIFEKMILSCLCRSSKLILNICNLSNAKQSGYSLKISKYSSTNANFPIITNKAKKRKTIENFGQPTSWTHPHILQKHELVRGITVEEFRGRRMQLLQNIQKFAINLNADLKTHLVVIPSSTKKFMSDKIPYVFRQNSDFLYLTGCLEPDSVLFLSIDDKSNYRSILFVRGKDKNAELWDGPRTGFDNAPNFFGVDEAYAIEEIKIFLNTYIRENPKLTVWYDKNASDQAKITDIVQSSINLLTPNTIESPTLFIHKLRVIKSKSEIALMRKTCEIASESINETIKETKPGDSEHHIYARVDYKCRLRNASFLAYPPVVASGSNATTIHYISNTQLTKNGDLVLMDAGCEFGGYTSDITRTWPVNGKFSNLQQVLYEMLLMLQTELIDILLKEGGRTLDELFDTMCLKLGKFLQEIGLISKKLQGMELARAAYSFCPHHVSHYLGMDVHDTPLISRSTKLVPGMVCTIEPGIYIAADRLDVPEEFRGIGMRIEDDVLITSTYSVEILTEKCVKDPKNIEQLFK